jgi:hypothetical protein
VSYGTSHRNHVDNLAGLVLPRYSMYNRSPKNGTRAELQYLSRYVSRKSPLHYGAKAIANTAEVRGSIPCDSIGVCA